MRLRTAALVPAVSLALAVGGCGGGGEAAEELTPPTTATATTVATAETTAPPPAQEPEQGPEKAEEPDQDPGEFMRTLFEQSLLGQHARVWEQLHPSHKDAVPRSRFVECRNVAEDDIAGVEMLSFEVLDVYDEPTTIPGQADETLSKAVTYKVTLKIPILEEPQSVTDTGHLLAVDGEWTWMLDTDHYTAYEAGTCPDTAE